MERFILKKTAVSVVLIQLLCLSASLWLVSAASNASCVMDNEPPLLDGPGDFDAPISHGLESATREEMQEQIGVLSRQVEELQAVNYQTTIMMYVFVVVSAFLVLMLMLFVMFRRPTLIVRTTR